MFFVIKSLKAKKNVASVALVITIFIVSFPLLLVKVNAQSTCTGANEISLTEFIELGFPDPDNQSQNIDYDGAFIEELENFIKEKGGNIEDICMDTTQVTGIIQFPLGDSFTFQVCGAGSVPVKSANLDSAFISIPIVCCEPGNTRAGIDYNAVARCCPYSEEHEGNAVSFDTDDGTCYYNDYEGLSSTSAVAPYELDVTASEEGDTITPGEEIEIEEVVVPNETKYDVEDLNINKGCKTEDNTAQATACDKCIGQGGIWTAIGCVDVTPLGILTGLIRIAFGVMGGVALVQLIIAGLMYQSGQDAKIAEAKEKFKATLFGIALLVFSVLILRILGINVLDVIPIGSV